MSDTLNPGSPRPAPASLSPTPPFKKEGLLPLTSDDVALNYRTQYRPKLLAGYAAEKAALAAGRVYAGLPCMKVMHISLCFDGTNNHEPSDKTAQPPTTSNVARLYHASLGADQGTASTLNKKGFYAYYMPGVGTEFKEVGELTPDAWGLKAGLGGERRINWGLTRLLDAVGRACLQDPLPEKTAFDLVQAMGTSLKEDVFLGASLFKDGYTRRTQALQAPLAALQKTVEKAHSHKTIARIITIRLYVYGFSRGAAEARAFANWLEALTKVEIDGETCYLFAGIPICIAFLGIFDTVAASGVAYVAPFAEGHMSWADGAMRLSDSEQFLERCVHMVATHEQRACFPLDSIRRKANPENPSCPSTYRNGTVEYLYPGMHSDVGGGYPPGDQGKSLAGPQDVMSQIPLHHMYAEAYAVGAPLQAPKDALSAEQKKNWPWLEMERQSLKDFDASETLTHRFNAWLSVHQTGPLEEAMAREVELLTAWRINRYASFHFGNSSAYQHVKDKDMTTQEADALKALHTYQLAEKTGTLLQQTEEQTAAHKRNEETKEKYERRMGISPPLQLNLSKDFEPTLDHHQLNMAMLEFRRDYMPKEWKLAVEGDAISWVSVAHVAFGGLLYLTNEQDEAEDYTRMRSAGNDAYPRLWDLQQHQPVDDTARALIAFFDEQVHDSRAWFMNAALGEREVFSDYFRYRGIFFDDESNKSLSLLASAGQVIGVAIAVASMGLSIKRKDPRYLLGLIAPSLGIPLFRGKVGAPEVSAFDTLTNTALPMLENVESLRVFTKDTGSLVKRANALPLPPVLSEENATTPGLKAILKAAETAKAMKEAEEAIAKLPAEARPGWLEQLKGVAGGAGG